MTIQNWSRVRGAGVGLVLALFGCSQQGEKRDFIGPPDSKPVDQTISAVVVTPGLGTVQLGEPIAFGAFGRKASGDSVGVDVTWTASGGEVDGNGVFTASATGSYHVVARSNSQAEKADSATVYVVGQDNPITAVTLAPKQLSLKIGQAHKFTASAKFQTGQEAPIPIYWSASGGVIDDEGNYVAIEAGSFQVIAIAANGITDTAEVTVSKSPLLLSVGVEPAEAEVVSGADEQFTVNAKWSDGSTALPNVEYSSEGGTIDATGRFTALADSGQFQIRATVAGAEAPAFATVRIKSPTVTDIDIVPGSAKLARGAWSLFLASAKYSNNSTKLVRPTWTATGGSIDGNGIYRAGSAAGTFRVIASYSSTLADTAEVFIDTPVSTLTNLILNPSSTTLAAGRSQSFAVSGTWSNGSTTAPSVVYSATGGSITEAGVYTAGGTAGTFRVIATQEGGTKADTSSVSITLATVASITLSPATIGVLATKSVQYSVTGKLSDGSNATPAVTYTATGGTISSTGLFTAAAAPGTFRIIAKATSGAADTSLVTVSLPAAVLEEVVVSPAQINLQRGQGQQFVVSGVYSGGAAAAGSPAVIWSATGGTVSTSGLYSAGTTPGTYKVIAKQQSGALADTATVTIAAPAPVLTGLVLSPASSTLQAGSTQQYSTVGVWTNGGSGTPTVVYSATGGTISSNGLYSAGTTAGTFRVIVTQQSGGLADTSTVTVTAAPPQLTAIVATPNGVSVGAGSTQQYAVAGTWTNGGSGAPAVIWGATGGSISSTGLFTAGSTAGSFKIAVKQQNGTLADTVDVIVVAVAPTLTSLTVAPANVTVQTGVQQQFSVAALWSNGGKTLPAITWSATGGTVSTSGLFTAPTSAGTYRVIAKNGSVADTSVITVAAPVVTKVVVTPGTASVSAGAKQQFSATATWSDGVSRVAALSYSANGGSVTTAGLYTAPTSAGTYRVVASANGGSVSDTSSIAVTAVSNPPAGGGANNMFFNSAEAGCDSSNALFCDDFEDGDWYSKNCDQANGSGGLIQTDGWCGTIYGPVTAAVCNNAGVKSNCAASHGRATGAQGNVTMADHSLSTPSSDVYVRFYTKAESGYSFGAEKILSVNKDGAGVGGIYFGNLHINCGSNPASTGVLSWQPTAPETGCRNILTLSSGNWYYIELHINTSAGILQVWADNCGSNGASCPASPTLRLNLSGYRFPSGSVGSLWWENWANPGSTGTRLIDQIKVARTPVGFMQ